MQNRITKSQIDNLDINEIFVSNLMGKHENGAAKKHQNLEQYMDKEQVYKEKLMRCQQ